MALDDLILTEPDPTHGYPIQRAAVSGEWRFALELADPADADAEWLDLSDVYGGDRYQRGADDYMGRYRASLATVELRTDDDQLAPWGQDTSPLFGVDVTLDAGLLIRLGVFRVAAGVTVEWEPCWTGRVETWGDAAAARGQIRTHIITVVDLLSDLANVPTTSVDNVIYWPEYLQDNLTAAGWLFGVDMYGDMTSVAYLQDLNAVAAINRMDAGTDPAGLVWRTLRNGRMVVHPPPWDTTNTNRYPNPLLDAYPLGLVFNYSPDLTEIAYVDDDGQQPFGVTRTIAGVLNSFVVTAGADVYPIDDPVSAARYGVRPFTATWLTDNHAVVDDLMAARAFASQQALPLRTTLDMPGFWSALGIIDHLDPVTVIHQTHPGGLVVTAVGTVRNVIEERTWLGAGLLAWQSTLQIDVTATETVEALLPVESLAFEGSETSPLGGPSTAEFSWINPTQPSITPTEVQYRLIGQSLIWTTIPYDGVGADGLLVNWLEAATAYTFQVRLIRSVDGVITNASDIRSVSFTTAARIVPVPIPGDDPGDTDVIGTPPDDDCDDFEIDLQENDGTGWVTVDNFTGAELTANGDGTYRLTTPIPNSFFNDGSVYRFRSSCDGVTWLVGPSFDPPDNWEDPCVTPPALSGAPFDDPDLLVYVPQICAPDIIREAVSGIEGVKGSAYGEILSLIGAPTYRALKAVGSPEWDSAPGGIVAYGECPQIVGHTGDKTILARVDIADDSETVVLFEVAGMQLKIVPTTGGWRAVVIVYTPGLTTTVPSTTILTEDTYHLAATFEYATGNIFLYVDGVEENDIGGTDNVGTIHALPIWRVGAPPDSWITDCALFDRLLDPSELPGYQVPVTINQASGQADPTSTSPIDFDVVFAEAVTGFATGDVTLSGTAGATTATVTGSGTTYNVAVSGMTGSGTVIAAIAAGVCTSVATGFANAASTSSDNTVTFNAFSPISGVGWHSAYWADGPDMLALGLANNASVTNWPDEIGTEDMGGAVAIPKYLHSSASFNSNRVISFDGASDHRLSVLAAAVTAQAQPFTFVVIGQFTDVTLSGAGGPVGNATGPGMIDGGGPGTTNAGRLRLSAPGATPQYALQAGSAGTERKVGTADTNAHCFMMYWNGASSRFEVDGSGIALGGSPGAGQWDGITLGYPNGSGATNWRLRGEIAFVGVYFGDVETDGGWAAFKTWALSFYGITIA